MSTGFRFRLYPTPEQAHILLRWIGCQRHVYNSKTREDRYFRSFARKSLSLTGQSPPIDQKYAQFIGDDTAWLREVPSAVLRNGAVLWKQAYSRFFRGLGGRPGIHSKVGRQTVWLTSELFRFNPVLDDAGEVVSRQLVIGTSKHPVGIVAFKSHRAFEIPASIHLSVHAGQWHVSFSNEADVPEPKDEDTAAWLQSFEQDELRARTLGLDRGVVIPLAGSDGVKHDFIDVHRHRLSRHNQKARHWQRIAARRQKGSRNRFKANQRVARYKQAQTNIRREFAHQVSHALVADTRYLLFVFEALKVKNMTRSAKGTQDAPGSNVRQKAGLNRSILASSWGQVRTYTQYKARRAGKLMVNVPPHHSSQACAQCGHTSPDNRKTQSEFVCTACGQVANADLNAARVIQARGVDLIRSGQWQKKSTKSCRVTRQKVGRDSPEPASLRPTPMESSVRHEDLTVFAQGTFEVGSPRYNLKV